MTLIYVDPYWLTISALDARAVVEWIALQSSVKSGSYKKKENNSPSFNVHVNIIAIFLQWPDFLKVMPSQEILPKRIQNSPYC